MNRSVRFSLYGLCLVAFFHIIELAEASEQEGKKPNALQVLKILKEGNDRFSSGQAIYEHTGAARLVLAGKENQKNYAIATIVSCSDSRVPVELIFDAGVLDLFVIRIAGNVCDTDEIGSVEYDLAHVHTPVLIILGHTQCGAVTAVTLAVDGEEHKLERNIPPLVDNIIPAVKRAMGQHKDLHGEEVIPYAIEENVWQGVEDLFMKSPATREMMQARKVKVLGAIYDVGTGVVKWLSLKKVDDILTKVNANPNKETNAFAEE